MGEDALDKERLKARQEQAKKLAQLAHIYEESLEPKVVLLFRRMEEMIARSQMPLTHINLVLDMGSFLMKTTWHLMMRLSFQVSSRLRLI